MYKKKSNRKSLPKNTSPHNYNNSQYIVSNLYTYCRSPLAQETGYNLREVEQHRDNILFKLGCVNCKISIKGMVKDNPKYYYSQLEFSVEDSKIPSKIRNLLLTIKRSKKGRISGSQIELYKDYIKDICLSSVEYNPNLKK